MEAAIRCEAVKKTYYTGDVETPALRGVDLTVNAGELFMLVGPSGCGKTTLISIIAAILNHDSGRCVVFGKDLDRLSPAEKTKFRGETIGFVFQAYNLIPTLTTAENVAVPLLIQGVAFGEALKRAEAMLEKVGLKNKVKQLPRDLSGGQQQRVAVARALVHGPKLIVCDEPTSALDKESGHQVLKLFKNVAAQEGRTLVIVTHDSRIFEFADRIAQMNDGVIERIANSPHELESN